jgi:hypothetical protein
VPPGTTLPPLGVDFPLKPRLKHNHTYNSVQGSRDSSAHQRSRRASPRITLPTLIPDSPTAHNRYLRQVFSLRLLLRNSACCRSVALGPRVTTVTSFTFLRLQKLSAGTDAAVGPLGLDTLHVISASPSDDYSVPVVQYQGELLSHVDMNKESLQSIAVRVRAEASSSIYT